VLDMISTVCFLKLDSQNSCLKIQQGSGYFSTVVNLRMQTDAVSPDLNVVTVRELLTSFGNQIMFTCTCQTCNAVHSSHCCS